MVDTPASDAATLATLNNDNNNDNNRRRIDQVDVRQAETQFNQLQRQLSRPDHDLDAQPPSPQPEHPSKDLERASDGGDEADERFDLREYLTSSNDASQAAGIKHKHVGVTWGNLEVNGIGGEDNRAGFPLYLDTVYRPLTFPPDLRSNVP